MDTDLSPPPLQKKNEKEKRESFMSRTGRNAKMKERGTRLYKGQKTPAPARRGEEKTHLGEQCCTIDLEKA